MQPRHRTSPGPIVCFLVLALAGCHPFQLRQLNKPGAAKRDERSVVKHAVFIDRKGRALEPSLSRHARPFATDSLYGAYVGRVMQGIRDDARQRRDQHRPPPRVLLRIHGGLKTLNSSLAATAEMREQIAAEKDADGYYPIFVNWETGGISAYWEHLTSLERGRTWETLRHPAIKPFAIAGRAASLLTIDLATGAARLPATATRQLFLATEGGPFDGTWYHNTLVECVPDAEPGRCPTVKQRGRKNIERQERALADALVRAQQSARRAATDSAKARAPRLVDTTSLIARLAAGHPEHGGEVAFSRFAYRRTGLQHAAHVTRGLAVSTPVRYYFKALPRGIRPHAPASPLVRALGWLPPVVIEVGVLDGLGPRAWDVMRRRSKLVFRAADEVDRRANDVDDFGAGTGALSLLLDSLETLTASDPSLRSTLVGHSMGAIVATEILRARSRRLEFDNIVLMAAAATVREVETSVFPYLQRHDSTQFYNLVLHPYSEVREFNWLILPMPPGSLLEWIDNYFANPETEADRMAGKYANLVRSAFLIPDDIRGRTHIKAFGFQSGTGCGRRDLPYRHGDFNHRTVAYWREGFWKPGRTRCEPTDAQMTAGASSGASR